MPDPNDEISRLRLQGIKLAKAGDLGGARECFREALGLLKKLDPVPPVQHIELLADLANTYAFEHKRAETEKVLEEAWQILDEQADRPAYLRRRLSQILGFCTGTTVGVGWTAIFMLAGAYFTIRFFSGARLAWGAPLNAPSLILIALLPALLVGASNAGQLLRNWLIGTTRLLVGFAVGFGIGCVLAARLRDGSRLDLVG